MKYGQPRGSDGNGIEKMDENMPSTGPYICGLAFLECNTDIP